MSLINDALKKAQRQRETATPPAGAAPSTPPVEGSNVSRIAKRRQPLPARTLMLLVTGGILLLVTGGGIAVVLFNLDTTPPAPIKATTARRPVPHPPVLAAPIAVSMPPAKPVAPPPPSPPPAVVAPIVTPVISAPVAPAVPATPAANPAANLFLDAMRITGVRVAGADSKVIMNDHIVRLGELVDPATGLRLTQITTSDLVFIDATGFKYDKPLP